MKKVIILVLSLLLCLEIPLRTGAEGMAACTVTADSIPTPPGKEITVPVRIAQNRGFTNFAISLEYDHENLTLLRINTADEEEVYLCGTRVAVNTAWKNSKSTCGYIVSASYREVMEDGILFTATFRVSETLKEYTTVTPVIHYIRNNTESFQDFTDIPVDVKISTVTPIVAGDVTGDGVVEYDDVMLVYKVSQNLETLTEEQRLLADMNGDEKVDGSDVEEIYRIYTGG